MKAIYYSEPGSDLCCVLSRLHFLDGNLALADAVTGAHLLHGRDVFRAEVDQALVEAVDLRLDHERGQRVLVVRSRRVY